MDQNPGFGFLPLCPDLQWSSASRGFFVHGSGLHPRLRVQQASETCMTLAEYIAQQWEILREYGLIKGEGK
ncbi:TPA: hypothetical protein L5G20_006470 [Pseudomonas aeruginosa]|nr:hypothetical protein [Pseudomonas aeruginosa]